MSRNPPATDRNLFAFLDAFGIAHRTYEHAPVFTVEESQDLCAHVPGGHTKNLFFAFIYNAIGVPVAAGVLYPTFGILLSPVIAASAMALSSVSVIGNALRLRWIKLDQTQANSSFI